MAEKISENKVERVQNRNLVPAKKGEVRNPKGRGKGNVSIWTRVKRKLREKVAEGPHAGKQYADLVADAIVRDALKGKWQAVKEVLDRDDGVPGQADHAMFGGFDPRELSDDELASIERILAAACRRAGLVAQEPGRN